MRTIRILQEHVRISDPHVTSDNADRLSILGNVFDPLMRVRPDGLFDPCLAASYSLSSDARTWSFTIRDDVSFHDGSPLSADDVVFSLQRMRDEDLDGELGTRGVIRGYLEGSEIEKTGRYEVILRTPSPMADLCDLLCEIPILSHKNGAKGLVGTGRFRIEDNSEGLVILESNHVRLQFEAQKDAEARLRQVIEGSANIATKLASHQMNTQGVRIAQSSTSVCATFMFNFNGEHGQNPHLRRAINLAIDVDALIRDVMHGAADPLSGPLTKRHLGFDADVAVWPYDPQAARRELKQGGVKAGTSILIDIPQVLPDEAPRLAEAIAAYLGEVGLRAEVRTDDDRPGYAMRVRDKKIGDLACFDSSPSSTFRVYREKFHSGFAGPWWLGYTNAEFDALVDRARGTIDLPQRQTIYQQAFSILHEDAPWVFLYNPLRLTAIGNDLADWDPSTGGLLLF